MAWSAGAILTAAQLNTYAPQTWSTWTPTYSAETGTLTSVSTTSARFVAYGKTIHWTLALTITNAGTATNGFRFTLPATALASGVHIGAGREGSAGHMLQVHAFSTTLGYAIKYDNTTTIATGRVLNLSGTYEKA